MGDSKCHTEKDKLILISYYILYLLYHDHLNIPYQYKYPEHIVS